MRVGAATLEYLAYGSNMCGARLRERAPSARALAAIGLPDRALRFHKRGWEDGSGKCNLVRRPGATAYGVVWSIDRREKGALDAAEGLGRGYRERRMRVDLAGEELAVFTYLAQGSHVDESLRPYDWYLAYVVAGAREHGLARDYVERLLAVPSVADPDRERAARHRALLAEARRPSATP